MKLEWRSEWTKPSLIGTISFGVGVGVGYGIRSYLNYRLVKNMSSITEKIEIIEDQLEFELDLPDEITMIEEEEIESIEYVNESVTYSSSTFPDIEEDWDYEEEMKNRNPEYPYIIHRDEFDDDEHGWDKVTLTYYKGDNVLCDTDDTPIYNAEKIVGELIFGKGSQDPNVVFIRNEKLQAEYEVLLDNGYYQVEVLGDEFMSNFENQKTPLHKFKEE